MKYSKETRFQVDGMLGSLARKLRIFGFDTAYQSDSVDDELLKTSKKEHRVLVTSDRELYGRTRKHDIESILITDTIDETNLLFIFKSLDLEFSELSPVFSRCSRCNGSLERADDAGITVSSEQMRDPRTVFRCVKCQKTYWEGSHWRKLRKTAEIIRLGLEHEKTVNH